MPIYEFRCLKCSQITELLVMGSAQDSVEIKCRHCDAGELERVLSASNFAVNSGGGSGAGVSTQSRKCAGGSCTTMNIPGPDG